MAAGRRAVEAARRAGRNEGREGWLRRRRQSERRRESVERAI
jgi:hypothetical protein